MNFLDELNEAQKAAALNFEGPMMVIAGAGSGKTRVLTYRIAHIINQGVDPFQILALTFTNKAAKEMKKRIATIVGDQDARDIWMGTFHSVFAKILRIEAEKINYPRNFSIYDTQDSKSLIKDVIKGLNLDEKVYKPNIVFNRISASKNNLISPEAYRTNVEISSEDMQAGRPRMADIYASYANRCYKAGAMDFDDLLYKTNVLLRDYPDVLLKYQHKFNFILVDEYQDTNFAQYLIVKQLSAVHENICVVGDDAQSIYSFRGANIQNILNFQRDYPDCKMFKLEQNYRSTKVIVEAANSVIAKNKDQIQKEVWTQNDQGELILLHRALSDNDEGYFVANQIFEIKSRESASYDDFAILYRTNAQSRSFEEALRKINVPYKIYGGLSFYQRKEIKDLLAYFRLSANHKDEEALKRVINYPARGIGKTTMEKLIISSTENGISIWEILSSPKSYNVSINSGTISKLQNFKTMVESFAAELEIKSAFDIGQHIAQSSGILKELYSDKTPEGLARYENIQELLNGMKEFSDQIDPDDPEKINTMTDFLIDVALLTDIDNDDDTEEKVSMMTIHAAKGLEYPYVNVVGLEENLFPSQLSLNSRADLEEERRLFYVALTRAEKRATLSYALTRYRWGNLTQCEPSRFIEDIALEHLNIPAVTSRRPDPMRRTSFDKERQSYQQMPSAHQKIAGKKLTRVNATSNSIGAASKLEGLDVGVEVEHARFGKGKVIKIEGNAPDLKATVFFPTAGQKQLLLKFAKLKILK